MLKVACCPGPRPRGAGAAGVHTWWAGAHPHPEHRAPCRPARNGATVTRVPPSEGLTAAAGVATRLPGSMQPAAMIHAGKAQVPGTSAPPARPHGGHGARLPGSPCVAHRRPQRDDSRHSPQVSAAVMGAAVNLDHCPAIAATPPPPSRGSKAWRSAPAAAPSAASRRHRRNIGRAFTCAAIGATMAVSSAPAVSSVGVAAFSHVLAVFLGYCVLVGSLFRSVPQIVKVRPARSGGASCHTAAAGLAAGWQPPGWQAIPRWCWPLSLSSTVVQPCGGRALIALRVWLPPVWRAGVACQERGRPVPHLQHCGAAVLHSGVCLQHQSGGG